MLVGEQRVPRDEMHQYIRCLANLRLFHESNGGQRAYIVVR